MVAPTSFYGVELGPGDGAGTGASPVEEVLDLVGLLRPTAPVAPLVRIGGEKDGAYLVPDVLHGISACFSPGANRIKHFEDELLDRYGIRSHMCDFSCEAEDFRTPIREGEQTFEKLWLDTAPGEDNVSLERWVERHDRGGDLLLQIDIEGAEYRNLMATPDELLQRFRVIVIELHGLDRALEAAVLRGVLTPLFTRLAQWFTVVHAHPNNCCGEVAVPGTEVRIPRVLELTLLRHDHFEPSSEPAPLPHPLDLERNVRRHPPLFLSPGWSVEPRSLESRVAMLEATLRHREEVSWPAADDRLDALTSITARALHTAGHRRRPPRSAGAGTVEVAAGRPYRLSSSGHGSPKRGEVAADGDYFFHTGTGTNQSIRIDLGRRRRIRRVELVNRRDAHRDRARFLFVALSGGGTPSVHPVPETARPQQTEWDACTVDLPDVVARFVTVTSPAHTALHLADVRVLAVDDADSVDGADGAGGSGAARPGRRSAVARLVRRLRTARSGAAS